MTRDIRTRRLALTSLALAALLPSLGSSIANIALPTIATHFNATFGETQWVVLAYLMAMTFSMLLAGWLADRVERRRLLIIGLAAMVVASLAGVTAPSLSMVVVARAVQGIGAAIAMTLVPVLALELADSQRVGQTMGLFGVMSALGTALGPSVGGLLVEAVGWQSIFAVNVPLGLFAMALGHWHVGASPYSNHAPTSAMGHIESLLTPFREPGLRASLIMNALVSAVLMATLVVGPFYLGSSLGLDAAWVGAVMSLGPIAAALVGVPAGRLVDRLGARRAVNVGLWGIAAGTAALTLLPRAAGLLGYVLPILVLTSGYAIFQAANTTLAVQGASRERRGAASGVLSLSRNVGLMVGTSVLGAVFTRNGLRVTFAVGLLLIALSLLVSARGYESRLGSPKTA